MSLYVNLLTLTSFGFHVFRHWLLLFPPPQSAPKHIISVKDTSDNSLNIYENVSSFLLLY